MDAQPTINKSVYGLGFRGGGGETRMWSDSTAFGSRCMGTPREPQGFVQQIMPNTGPYLRQTMMKELADAGHLNSDA